MIKLQLLSFGVSRMIWQAGIVVVRKFIVKRGEERHWHYLDFCTKSYLCHFGEFLHLGAILNCAIVVPP